MNYSDIQNALEVLGLPNMIRRDDIKKRYRELAFLYHPDRKDGSSQKMDEINRAYEILIDYIDNFRFAFDEDEFKRQNPSASYHSQFKF